MPHRPGFTVPRVAMPCLLLAMMAWLVPAWAEQPAPLPSPATAPITAPIIAPVAAPQPGPRPPARAVAAEDARRTLDILRDDKRRAELIAALEAIAAAAPAARANGAMPVTPPTPAPSPAPTSGTTSGPASGPAAPANAGVPAEAPPADPGLRLAPDSLGARMLLGASAVLEEITAQARDTVFAVGDLPALGRWVYAALTDPLMQGWLVGVVWRLAVVLAAGIGLGWLAQRALRRPHALWRERAGSAARAAEQVVAKEGLARAELGELEAPAGAGPAARLDGVAFGRRLSLALGRLGLELAPVAAFLLAAHVVLATPLGGSRLTQLVMIALVQALALWRAACALATALAVPENAVARLLPVADETAAWLRRWIARIVGIALFATATLQAALLLGLPRPAHSGWLRLASLVCAVCVVIMIIQRRAAVAAWLRGDEADTGAFAGLRRVLAPVWHWLAIVYVAAVWLVWATDFGLEQTNLLPALIATLVLLVLVRVATEAIIRAVERRLTPSAALTERYPGLESRARGYRPLLRGAISLTALVVGLLLLGEIWGFAPLRWLATSRTGRDMLSGFGTIAITLAVALAVWEGVNLALARHVAMLAETQAARATRLRTLLPMLRTALMITILVVAGLTVLSQIGINIAPLLAGAGVLGLAIGIGSQKLVQDLITGLFLLLENAMQVGDVVTVAGVTGVVEDLSIRSIRLRAEDGSVQIIPFSAVTGVTNMTRDFSHAVIEVVVSYEEDYDKVAAALTEIAAEMRAEPLWQGDILGDIDVMGLVRMDASAAVVKCRIKCGPFARWKVQREFNRRMKLGFAARGIAVPAPAPAPAPAPR